MLSTTGGLAGNNMRNEKGQFIKGHKPIITDEGRLKISIANKGKKKPVEMFNDDWRKKQSIAHQNQSRERTLEWNKNISLSKIGKHYKSLSDSKMGENNPAWKGGITPIHKKLRNTKEYRLWRKAVLERDDYTCIWCGSKDNLEVDHIKPFSHYPELRFAIDNGRCLCHKCHITTETYAGKSKTWG